MTNKALYTIALDVDGVLQDCNSHVRQIAQYVLNRPLPHPADHKHFEFDKSLGLSTDEWSRVAEVVRQSTATRDMEWLDGAREFVDELRKYGHDVFFLTSHWHDAPHWVTHREARLKLNWPNCDVVFTHNKARCQFDYLIDDKLENVLRVGAAGLLFAQPWNQHAPNYVRRWNSYQQLLEFLNQ